jgi:hypothetical protein
MSLFLCVLFNDAVSIANYITSDFLIRIVLGWSPIGSTRHIGHQLCQPRVIMMM